MKAPGWLTFAETLVCPQPGTEFSGDKLGAKTVSDLLVDRYTRPKSIRSIISDKPGVKFVHRCYTNGNRPLGMSGTSGNARSEREHWEASAERASPFDGKIDSH